MSGLKNAKGDVGMLRNSYKKRIAAGEMVLGSEFKMSFLGQNQLLEVMVRTTQTPEYKRQEVEDFGPMGMGINQQGPLINKGQITVTCVEDLNGSVMEFVRDCVVNKKHVDIELQQTPESLGGSAPDALIHKMFDCTIGSEAVDLSTEDNTVLVKPSLLINYNWAEPESGR